MHWAPVRADIPADPEVDFCPPQPPPVWKVKQMSANVKGGGLICALLEPSYVVRDVGNAVKCWGRNSNGGQGAGDEEDRGDEPGEMGNALIAVDLGTNRTAVAISVGGSYACAILDNGLLKCWGYNHVAQLGLGDFDDRGDSAGEMGDNLPAVDLGGLTPVKISAGSQGPCVLLDDGTLKCWGKVYYPNPPDTMGITLPVVPVGTDPFQTPDLSAIDLPPQYGSHICVILGPDNGLIKCWGVNYYGQLGLGDTVERTDGSGDVVELRGYPVDYFARFHPARAVDTGDAFSCALLSHGYVKCWGGNEQGGLGLGDTDNRGDGPNEMGANLPWVDLGSRAATSIAVGKYHACVVLDDRTIKCWGGNSRGELGLGDFEHRGDEPGELGDALPVIDLGAGRVPLSITCSGQRTCVVLDDRETVLCWGRGEYGGLGTGDAIDRGGVAGDMGDALEPVDFGEPIPAVCLVRPPLYEILSIALEAFD